MQEQVIGQCNRNNLHRAYVYLAENAYRRLAHFYKYLIQMLCSSVSASPLRTVTETSVRLKLNPMHSLSTCCRKGTRGATLLRSRGRTAPQPMWMREFGQMTFRPFMPGCRLRSASKLHKLKNTGQPALRHRQNCMRNPPMEALARLVWLTNHHKPEMCIFAPLEICGCCKWTACMTS